MLRNTPPFILSFVKTALVAWCLQASATPQLAGQDQPIPRQGPSSGNSVLDGRVFDSAPGNPVSGARVSLIGTTYRTTTDENGRFSFVNLPAAVYGVDVRHELLEQTGKLAAPKEVSLSGNDTSSVTLIFSLPNEQKTFLCPASDQNNQSAVVFGFVRNVYTQQSVVGARVVFQGSWRQADLTSGTGFYLACNVPTDGPVVNMVEYGENPADPSILQLSPGELKRFDIDLALATVETSAPETAPKTRSIGFGIGTNVILLGLSGGDNLLDDALGIEGFFRLSTALGFEMDGGFSRSIHQLRNAEHEYGLFEVYLEPRMTLQPLPQPFAFFVGGHVGRAWERVVELDAEFRGSGFGLGGNGGLRFYVDQRVSIETGVALGVYSFGDFQFSGGTRWQECEATQMQLGTPMPEAVLACAPEYSTEPMCTSWENGSCTGVGDQPWILHTDSGRKDSWRRAWIGVAIAWGKN